MKAIRFYVENPSFICFTDSSKNPDFINDGFLAENEEHAAKVAAALIEFNYGIEYAINSDWYVSEGNNEGHTVDVACAYLD